METATETAIDSELFDRLKKRLSDAGANAAAESLCQALVEAKDYAKLFYALLLKKRVVMGVSPLPTAPAAELNPTQQEEYELAIRDACRSVGELFLRGNQIPQAYSYFRMIGDVSPVSEALDRFVPQPEEDMQPFIDVAYYQGVNVKKGFDLVLDHYGICNAITTVGQYDPAHGMEGRNYCIQRLVRALHGQLIERLQSAVEQHQGLRSEAHTISELIAGRDWLFAEDAYYTDTSHLSSVVQMSIELDTPEDHRLARDLCAYGKKLGPMFQYPGNPPFEDLYSDVEVYLNTLLGEKVEAGIQHFRSKIVTDPHGPDTFAAEVLVRLLLRLHRDQEALEVARTYFINVDERQLGVPGVFELSQRLKDFRALAETARLRNDPVHYLAGLIAECQ
jgi:hypothetical protein